MTHSDPARRGTHAWLPHGACWTTVLAALAVALILGLAAASRWPSSAGAGGMQELVSQPVSQAPALDGKLEEMWLAAPATRVELRYGRLGGDRAYDMDLRAVHTSDAIYFAASWPGEAPTFGPQSESNKLIMHFEVDAPWEGAEDLMCLVACHTTYVDRSGTGRYITAETIPPGQTAPLPVGGGWRNGRWTFEWGRPLLSNNPFDVQFDDLDGHHRFFFKVMEGTLNRADPASDNLLLLFNTAP